MAAHVEHEFTGWFVVEEEHLRKLDQIIRQKCPESGKYRISVKRTDSAAYTTQDIEELCAEENGPSATISSVTYLVDSDVLTVKLSLVKGKRSFLEVIGADRGEVFLIAGDLRSYIDAEVMKWRLVGRKGMEFLNPALMFLMLGITFGASFLGHAPTGELEKALASRDVLEKLDFLIGQRPEARLSYTVWWIAIPMVLIAGLLFNLPSMLLHYLFPLDDFFIGKKKTMLQKKAALRQNLFWIVIVTTAISVGVAWIFQQRS